MLLEAAETMTEEITFGDWLRHKRKAAGMTLEELSEKAGCSTNYLSILERNKPHHQTGALPEPSYEIVEAIALALPGSPVREALELAGYRMRNRFPAAVKINPDGTGTVVEQDAEGHLQGRTLTDADARAIAEQLRDLFGPLLERGAEKPAEIPGKEKEDLQENN